MSQVKDETANPLKCMVTGCSLPAAYSIRLELRARPNTPAATADLSLCVCEQHKDVQWADVMTDDSWDKLGNQFQKLGYARPVRELSSIKLVRLE